VNNTHAPMTLRINAMLGSRQHYLQQLAEQNIAATQTTLSPDGVILKQPQSAASLPGFHEGWVTVQDEAAQYAAVLLDCQPGMRVLDACAAPGNKASHIAAKQPCDLLAIDCDASRVESIKTLQQRLHFQADIRCADATKPALWWDQQPFDRILVDAPCSGTGVIRRHPDIKYHRRLADLDHFIQQQKDLLHALWPLLRQGGKMLYVTCSLLPQENSQQVEQFIQQHRDAQLMDSQQLIPTENSWDGLFFASIMKAIEAVY
jgi:16S rRNA (cytosine967-C5)-methyltransferase